MKGYFDYDSDTIEKKVDENKMGNYAIGIITNDGKFIPKYIGRSDKYDLIERIKSHLKEFKDCTHFKYSYATSEKEAFEKECENYHDFKPKYNKIHPDKPNNTKYECPYCPDN